MKLVITVDVEADNQWLQNPPRTIDNVFKLDRFHSLSRKFGWLPTYLVTFEVANDPRAVDLIKPWLDRREAEVGAHLHPWTTPPTTASDKVKRFPNELSEPELKAKLVYLTERIKSAFGVAPTSYRAGRWGFDQRQARILKQLGYEVDASVTPMINWHDGNGPGKNGPDWSYESPMPHLLAPEGLLEVPMTILNTGSLAGFGPAERLVFKHPKILLSRAVRKFLLRPTWLSIFPESSPKDWQRLWQKALKLQLPVLEFMIHSSELVPAMSPYVKNERSLAKLYRNLEDMFAFFKKQQLEPATLTALSPSSAVPNP